ncbi:hypothetical protein E8E12_002763 [Didymella heteroderae]|uniref:Ubiquitin-like protease family profile domain-containing protein n=1 Tax=Didymella heteroderae TaxID=1769908 RepID=A0A9P4WL22_9PLEO|nr:hypothetical protein E8E12_002763 [Didymella heteroderae]
MASTKRDFRRAFDIPGGLHVAAEPQASPIRYVPGQWPQEDLNAANETAPASRASSFTTLARFAANLRLGVLNIPERLRKLFARPQQIVAVPVIREDGSCKRRLIDAGLEPTTPTHGDSQRTGLWLEMSPSPEYTEDLQGDSSADWPMEEFDSGTPSLPPRRILPLKASRVRSPIALFNLPQRPRTTPMRTQLLKRQLRTVEAVTPSSPLEARENRNAGARATVSSLEHLDPTVYFHNDLSSTFDSLRTPSPSPSRRKTIRWAPQGRVKSYYVDERISEMLDSTLESIRSPMPKPDFRDDQEEDDESSDDLQAVVLEEPETTSDSDDSVDGPSLDDHDSSLFDDSLEESRPSKELLDDLEEDFKNLLAQQPPAPPPPKPLIAPLSGSERIQLEDLAAKSNHGKNESFPIIPDKISARDFGTLLPAMFNGSAMAWLNDEIVNQYLSVLIKTLNDDCGFIFKRGGPAPPYHAFSSHWYTSIKGGVKKVERWAGRVGLGGSQFLNAKVVLFPICDGSHWRLLAVKPQEHTIEYLDSLGWDGSKYIQKLREYLQHELKDLYIEEEWKVMELQRSSRQLNGSDCGVFVLLNALVLMLGGEHKKVIASNGMLEARERLAMTIITGKPVELEY